MWEAESFWGVAEGLRVRLAWLGLEWGISEPIWSRVFSEGLWDEDTPIRVGTSFPNPSSVLGSTPLKRTELGDTVLRRDLLNWHILVAANGGQSGSHALLIARPAERW